MMSNKVWVYIDQFKGKAHAGSWEALGVGSSLAGKLGGGVTAVVFGAGAQGSCGRGLPVRGWRGIVCR